MNRPRLEGKKIAMLATNGFEESELVQPREAVTEAGGLVEIVSLERGNITSWQGSDWGKKFQVDKVVSEVSADDYDGLVLPGGVINPDHLRKNESAVEFVRSFFEQKKPVAAICHGPWMLVEADVVKERRLTSYDSIKTDLKNAGAEWVDAEVVVNNGLVTSRDPNDLDAFCKKMIEEFAEGRHAKAG